MSRSIVLRAAWASCMVSLLVLYSMMNAPSSSLKGRTLLNEDELQHSCSSMFDQNGGYVFYVVMIIYAFIGLGIVCDEFFVPALEVMIERYRIPANVAGATLMAAGSSSPEVFAAGIGAIGGSPVGTGTVIGSLLFNMCVIVGVTALVGGTTLLNIKTMVRDGFFYVVSLIYLGWTMWDGEVEWYESFPMLFVYVLYVLFCVGFDPLVRKCFGEKTGPPRDGDIPLAELDSMHHAASAGASADANADVDMLAEAGALGVPVGHDNEDAGPRENPHISKLKKGQSSLRDIMMHQETHEGHKEMALARMNSVKLVLGEAASSTNIDDIGTFVEEDEVEGPRRQLHFRAPSNGFMMLLFCLVLPLNILFRFSIPDVRVHRFRNWYLITFFNCIVWLGLLVYGMMYGAEKMACILGISPAVVGLTIGAIGTSTPDALASLLVARMGYGDMAISNAFGSNIFDILVGLGVPWTIYCCIVKPGGTVDTSEGGMFGTLQLLMITFVLFVVSTGLARMKLKAYVGVLLLVLYLAWVVCVFVTGHGIVWFVQELIKNKGHYPSSG